MNEKHSSTHTTGWEIFDEEGLHQVIKDVAFLHPALKNSTTPKMILRILSCFRERDAKVGGGT
jgi:hypothetical protein